MNKVSSDKKYYSDTAFKGCTPGIRVSYSYQEYAVCLAASKQRMMVQWHKRSSSIRTVWLAHIYGNLVLLSTFLHGYFKAGPPSATLAKHLSNVVVWFEVITGGVLLIGVILTCHVVLQWHQQVPIRLSGVTLPTGAIPTLPASVTRDGI